MTGFEWSLLIGLSLLWGGSFFFVGVAVSGLPPFSIVFLRVAIAALILHVVVRAFGPGMPKGGAVWLAFFGMGFLNNAIPFSLLVWGQTQIASGLASILNATTPLFGVVVAHFLTDDEPMRANRVAGVVIGFAGVAVMLAPELTGEMAGEVSGALLAQLACLGAALSYAFASVFGRRFKRMGVSPIATATGQVTASSILLLPLALLVDRPWELGMPSMSVWLSVLALASVSTALAYIAYFLLLETAGAVNLLLVTLLVPVGAILLGWLLLAERLSPEHGIGMALIALGLAAIDGRPTRWLKGRLFRSEKAG
ncbi:MAG: EamA family transporter [Hyphomicrobiales bacterium]|nr:MAG: EamA family transporter [Hyphomicrobiales bacterium]